ncbi:lipopolysaccharide heptosyltransferase II [uncultured Rubinisphaera sp.]|uniref:lipopolysaccharide heptosyltransferase II n=1 Tax=uncultured Rubinisphaera sp. TaxID=1678686 RepID=UPI0030D7CF86
MSDSRIVKLFNEIDPKRIVIIKPSALGDVVQTLPLLPVLKKRFPNATIDWVIRSELAGLIEGHPDLNQVMIYHRKGTLKDSFQLLKQIWKQHYDLTLDLQGLFRTGLMTAASRSRLRIGLETAREYSQLACHGLLPETDKQVPAHARYWKVAEVLGETGPPPAITLGIDPADRQTVDDLISEIPQPFFVIHPGAMWVTKRWPIASFAEIAARTCKEYGMSLVVVGTAGEQQDAESICQFVRQKCPHQQVLNLAGKTSLKQLALVLHAAEIVLTNDSGPMHLAAGMGTPVVGIFTCTSKERSGPPGDHHQLIQAQVPCAASYRKECPMKGSANMQCMSAVSIFQVWSSMQKAIQKNHLGNRVA